VGVPCPRAYFPSSLCSKLAAIIMAYRAVCTNVGNFTCTDTLHSTLLSSESSTLGILADTNLGWMAASRGNTERLDLVTEPSM